MDHVERPNWAPIVTDEPETHNLDRPKPTFEDDVGVGVPATFSKEAFCQAAFDAGRREQEELVGMEFGVLAGLTSKHGGELPNVHFVRLRCIVGIRTTGEPGGVPTRERRG